MRHVRAGQPVGRGGVVGCGQVALCRVSDAVEATEPDAARLDAAAECAGGPGDRVWPSPDHLAVSRPNGLKLLKSGSVGGFGRRKARSRVGDAIGSGFHPVFTSKYLAAVATEG